VTQSRSTSCIAPRWRSSRPSHFALCLHVNSSSPRFDGVVLKKSTVTTTTTSSIWQPLKAVTGGAHQSRRAVISVSEQVQQLKQIQEDIPAGSDPMAIDIPHRTKAEILETKSLRVVSSRKQLKPVDVVDEEESRRVVKRRTSSDLPEEAQIVAHIPPEVEDPVAHPKRSTTPEADPDGDQWDDLDAEDADDPLMVSDYVTEIFAYLKEVEVSGLSTILFYHLPQVFQKTTMPNPNYMEIQKDLAWKMRGISTDSFSSGQFAHPKPSTSNIPTAIPSFGPGAPPSPPSTTTPTLTDKPSRRSSVDSYPTPTDPPQLPTPPAYHSNVPSPANSMSPVTPPNYEGNSAKIVFSAGPNTMQILGDSVSPPHHHIHALKSSLPIPTYTKTQIHIDTKHPRQKTLSAHQHAAHQVEHYLRSSFAISSTPGDSFPLPCHRPFSFRIISRQTTICWDHMYVYRRKGGRDHLPRCFQLPLLCWSLLLRN